MKFVIDGNGLGQLAEALAGVNLHKGVKAGLENQMLAAKLDEMRFERDRAFRQQQAREGLPGNQAAAMFPGESARTHENLAYALGGAKPVRGFRYDEHGGLMTGADGMPLPDDDFGLPESLLRSDGFAAKAGLLRGYADTARQIEAFGLDGAAAAKLWGGVEERLRQNEMGRLGMEYAAKKDTEAMNHLLALQTGRTYQRYKPDAHGQVYAVDNGGVLQTPVSLGKVALMETQGNLNRERGGTERARQGVLRAQEYTEGFKPGYVVAQTNQANAGAAEKLAHADYYGMQTWATGQDTLRKNQEATKFRPPNNNEVVAYFTKTDPATGQKFIDHAEMRRAVDFAQRNGFADVTAAMPAYREWWGKAVRLSGGNETAVIEQAAAFAPSNKMGETAAQNLPPVTDYDRKAGALGKPGTPRFGEQTALLEEQARKLGLVLRRGGSERERLRAQQTLTALYERGVIPRDHVQVLWEYYAGQNAAPKKQ